MKLQAGGPSSLKKKRDIRACPRLTFAAIYRFLSQSFCEDIIVLGSLVQQHASGSNPFDVAFEQHDVTRSGSLHDLIAKARCRGGEYRYSNESRPLCFGYRELANTMNRIKVVLYVVCTGGLQAQRIE